MVKECAASASKAVARLKIGRSLTGPSRTDTAKPLRGPMDTKLIQMMAAEIYRRGWSDRSGGDSKRINLTGSRAHAEKTSPGLTGVRSGVQLGRAQRCARNRNSAEFSRPNQRNADRASGHNGGNMDGGNAHNDDNAVDRSTGRAHRDSRTSHNRASRQSGRRSCRPGPTHNCHDSDNKPARSVLAAAR
jgi:hypothetical protein